MTQQAYLGLTDDGYWALYAGDGSEDERTLLGVGQPFEPGQAINEAVAEIQAWAEANGYELVTPRYSTMDVGLLDVIDAETFDEVFGTDEDEAS